MNSVRERSFRRNVAVFFRIAFRVWLGGGEAVRRFGFRRVLEGLASENQFIHGRDGKSILEGGCSRAERKAARSLYLICAITGKSLLMIFGK